ncbi:hypothetical protein Glove_33g35 [Diversispora epigaea]|uniref:BTB domain-containing protein n=1 Tax=Diversispora epigaea TaxID=1348612 RepID=A0A397JLJ3_9GLOM|nr:hypothetical protein Glove_33g35 [Diversispora epigaea]
MSLKFFDKLSQNFIELLNDKNDYNVVIEVENKEKSFTAHSNVLKYRSSYFRQELENIQPNENNIKIITKPSISSKIFDAILKYVYSGIVNLEKFETRFIFDLMLMANEFEFAELSKKLETILIEDKASWLKTHFSLVYRTIFVKENFKNLENFCNDIVVKYPNLIFDSSDFNSLPESALVSLIKRDDIQMKEVEIWDYVIKWGITQNPTLPINPGDWTKENFLTLKTTLQQCLPHIRYFHITNIEIYDKIRPYREIFQTLSATTIKKNVWACEDLQDKASWLKTHFSLVYRTIFVKENFKNLENFCNDIVVKYPNLIFDSSDFNSLPESALVSLIKRDDIQMKEVEIWDYVIKWGITQNPTLPINPGDWTKENFLTLKTTLQQCLPHIRYFHITNIEIYDKIRPYREIFQTLSATTIKKNYFYIAFALYRYPVVGWAYGKGLVYSHKKRRKITTLFFLAVHIMVWFLALCKKLVLIKLTIAWLRWNKKKKDKIRPYKKILDKQLWQDIKLHLIVPERPIKSIILPARSVLVTELPPRANNPKVTFSTIISEDHAAEISSWIDRKTSTYSTTNVPYKFELILCGTRDGFAPQTFWNICHGHACTIIVVKVKGTHEILGGYNPLAWDNKNIKDQWMETKDSFIFSLKNGNIQNSILSRVKIIDRAILNSRKNDQKFHGPYFGFGFGLYSNKSNFNSNGLNRCDNWNKYYEKCIKMSAETFSIDNYEVSSKTNILTELAIICLILIINKEKTCIELPKARIPPQSCYISRYIHTLHELHDLLEETKSGKSSARIPPQSCYISRYIHTLHELHDLLEETKSGKSSESTTSSANTHNIDDEITTEK